MGLRKHSRDPPGAQKRQRNVRHGRHVAPAQIIRGETPRNGRNQRQRHRLLRPLHNGLVWREPEPPANPPTNPAASRRQRLRLQLDAPADLRRPDPHKMRRLRPIGLDVRFLLL